MKSFSTLFILISAVSATTITALPSFAQTTPIPVTGGSLSITNNFVTGVTSLNSGASILTSFGPISVSSGTINNANSQAGAVIQNGVLTAPPSRPDQVGDSFSASGTGSGALLGNTLNNFNYAITGNISSLVFTPSGNVQPVSSQVTFALNGGSVSLPTSLVGSLSGGTTGGTTTGGTTSVPLTGGIFSATNTTGVGTTYNSATALTSLGTINFTSVTGGALTIPAIGFTSVGVSNPSRFPVAGDVVNVNNTISSGTISNQSFTNAPLNGTGLVQTFSQTASNVFVLTGSISSGTIGLPSSLVTSLSSNTGSTTGGNTGGTTTSIPSNLVASVQNARNILNIQSIPDVAKPFLPTSSLAGSRIHPDLFAR
jgi:hypothetical protein